MPRCLPLLVVIAIACCGDASPREADSFEIGLHASACLQPCRQFALRLDASGRVHVHNPAGEPRLATFDFEVEAERARALYQSMLRGNFMQLQDQYGSDAGTCEDRAVSVLSLAADSGFKQVVYRRGCAEAQSLLAFEQQLRELTAVEQLLSSTAGADCEIAGRPLSFAPVYTLRQPDATGVGFLRFTNTATGRRFIVQGCSGKELSQGSVSVSPDCSAQLQSDADKPQRWPGTNVSRTTTFVEGSGGDANSESLAFISILESSDAATAAQVGLLGASCEGGEP